MHTVAFYSYKGGVGRSLLLANSGRFLALAGKKVVALDLDFEAPGLHYKLGALEVLARARAGVLHGAVDELLAVLSDAGGQPVADFAVAVDLPSDCRGSLHLIPAGSAPSAQYWRALAKLSDMTRAETVGGGLAEAVLDLQARIEDELAPDFLLLDARTGITELGGLATTIVADRVVCLTTASQESIEGTLLVANAVRAAPRLPGQAEIEIEFLLTRIDFGVAEAGVVPAELEIERVPSHADSGRNKGRSLDSVLNFSAVLPHDRTIANEERVLGGERTHDRRASLFEASLAWIEKSFPSLTSDASIARERMAAVDKAWHELTDHRWLVHGGPGSYQQWPTSRLRTGVRISAHGKDRQERFADIVAYDRPSSEPHAKAVLVVEYVANEDRDQVAQWWIQDGEAGIVCLLGDASSEARLFSRHGHDGSMRRSQRWDLPMPYEFEALYDPTDVSVETLIDAVRRGYSQYVPRLMVEWILASGPMSWPSERARQILEGLAGVSDPETATRVLRGISPYRHNHDIWRGRSFSDNSIPDTSIEGPIWRELFTPLWWRLPVEASIAVAEERPLRIRPFRHVALQTLAEDFLGLRYDPDAESRRPEALMLRHEPAGVTFEQRSGDSPLAIGRNSLHDKDLQSKDIGELTERLIQSRFVLTSGFLGDYEPEAAHVVLYKTAIEATAAKLAIPHQSLATITLLHQTIHALTHLGRDLDKRQWRNFDLPSAASPGFEPSVVHATIAQYFSYRFLLYLEDRTLLDGFERLAEYQPPAYQQWRRMKALPLEEMRGWLMSIRRGVPGALNSPPI
jgi:cellulose biosynthesis protein BcsQ